MAITTEQPWTNLYALKFGRLGAMDRRMMAANRTGPYLRGIASFACICHSLGAFVHAHLIRHSRQCAGHFLLVDNCFSLLSGYPTEGRPRELIEHCARAPFSSPLSLASVSNFQNLL